MAASRGGEQQQTAKRRSSAALPEPKRKRWAAGPLPLACGQPASSPQANHKGFSSAALFAAATAANGLRITVHNGVPAIEPLHGGPPSPVFAPGFIRQAGHNQAVPAQRMTRSSYFPLDVATPSSSPQQGNPSSAEQVSGPGQKVSSSEALQAARLAAKKALCPSGALSLTVPATPTSASANLAAESGAPSPVARTSADSKKSSPVASTSSAPVKMDEEPAEDKQRASVTNKRTGSDMNEQQDTLRSPSRRTRKRSPSPVYRRTRLSKSPPARGRGWQRHARSRSHSPAPPGSLRESHFRKFPITELTESGTPYRDRMRALKQKWGATVAEMLGKSQQGLTKDDYTEGLEVLKSLVNQMSFP